jgi:type IV pilus assembly protein PilO
MTLSEDLNFADQGGEFDEGAAPYPVLFGVTFTPPIIGIIAGVVGLGGALYMLLNLVMPSWDAYQAQQGKISEIQGQITQKKISVKQIDKVQAEQAQAKQQKIKVLSLFANEKSLDTLLLDTNRLVESDSTVPVTDVTPKLNKFVPDSGEAEIITDGSFGKEVDNKLKRSKISLEIVGTFEQTQSIMRNIERLQPLLIVTNYQSTLAAPEPILPSDQGKKLRLGPAKITTSFQLQALMPLTPEELAKAAQKAQAQAKPKK